MANSEGTFGGNGSVCWKVDVHNAKGTPKSERKDGMGHWEQEGHDGTPAVAEFRITLKRPKDKPEDLVTGLRNAAKQIEDGGAEASFTLTIEQHQHKQIRIKWPSEAEDFVPTTPSSTV